MITSEIDFENARLHEKLILCECMVIYVYLNMVAIVIVMVTGDDKVTPRQSTNCVLAWKRRVFRSTFINIT